MTGTGVPTRARWEARPVLAAALTVSVVALPLGLSYFATVALAPLVEGLALGWQILLLGSVAVSVGVAAERVFRRALPLAALLRMTMLFPDRAPSRYKLARSAGSPGQLAERARTHTGETIGEAATRILGLVSALGAHDRRTRGHSERVRVFTDVVAAELHLDPDDCDRLRWAALLHDIGKIEVATSILNKPAGLDAEEWVEIRRHPERGAALAGPLSDWLGPWGDAIEQHHERFDGGGYPHGLAGHEISLAGRVVAVADVFEVMTAARSYKRPMSVRAARRELASVAGTQLDPACVRAFLGASLPRVLWAVGPLALLVNLPFLRGLAEVGRAVEQAGSAVTTQAVTTAVAATTAVAVVAAPGAGAVESPQAEPRPTASHHASGQPGPAGDEGGGSGTEGSGEGPGEGPDEGRGTAPGAAGPTRSPTASPTPTPSASSDPQPSPQPGGSVVIGPSTLPSLIATLLPTPTASAAPSPSSTGNSGSGNNRDPAEPVVVGPLIPVLLQPVSFLVTSLELDVTFVCRMDGDDRAPCASTVTYKGLKKGKHRFEVYAVNADGRKSDTVRWEFTVL